MAQWLTSVQIENGNNLDTGKTAGDAVSLRAYDVDGTSYTTFATLTANNSPTMTLSGAVTGVTQSANDNSTKLATTAYVDGASDINWYLSAVTVNSISDVDFTVSGGGSSIDGVDFSHALTAHSDVTAGGTTGEMLYWTGSAWLDTYTSATQHLTYSNTALTIGSALNLVVNSGIITMNDSNNRITLNATVGGYTEGTYYETDTVGTHAFDNHISFLGQPAPTTDTAGWARLYVQAAADDIEFRNDSGTIYVLNKPDWSNVQNKPSTLVTGTGVANRVALWNTTSDLDSDANVTWDGTTFNIGGDLTATSKSFLIDHPLDSTKKLRYGSLEGPEHGVYLRGEVEGNTIKLPEYWKELVDEDTITVQLTPVRSFQKLYVKSKSSTEIKIGNSNIFSRKIKADYIIHAMRKDVEPLKVEY